ncbi:hypothetical protein [Candidatus Leptofilum sp.]|uniref:hypothetical protein n=1 Tax=Candidatus Leptofilum sp. TaxID=3241576 RepID=UPI003B5A9DF2
MEILQNLQAEDITQLIVIAAVLLIVLFLARLAFKLTASLMRIGCLTIFFIVAAVALLRMFSG